MRLVPIGLAIGGVIGLAIAQSMESLLAGLSPTDPLAFAAAAIVLVVVGISASYIPARRATRVDPMHALRQQ
jgi:ABC-type antimicrobial peptide transport system permease subunit